MQTNQEMEVDEILRDFGRRAAARADLEANWQLNREFAQGNQFVRVSGGEVRTIYKDFYWQQQSAYNHIAPILESRLARLFKIRPTMSVRPSSDNETEVEAAKLSGKILSSAAKRELLFETVKAGLFNGKEGELSETVKRKLLEILGFTGWEFCVDQINQEDAQNKDKKE